MKFEEWVKESFPNKGNNMHTSYSLEDMHTAFYAGTMHGSNEKETDNNGNGGQFGSPEQMPKKKACKAKTSSLIAQIGAALWVAFWCVKKFLTAGGETNDIILSGFAIAACFCPVYFNMILDKVKSIKFGD